MLCFVSFCLFVSVSFFFSHHARGASRRAPLELTETAASNAPRGGAGRPGALSGANRGEPARTTKEELVVLPAGMEPKEVEQAAWRDLVATKKDVVEASIEGWKAAVGTWERAAEDQA